MKQDVITRLKHAYWDLTFVHLNEENLSSQVEELKERLLHLIYDMEHVRESGGFPRYAQNGMQNERSGN